MLNIGKKEQLVMQKFNSKREEFNYYVLKSDWYKKQGDIENYKKCLQRATELKAELEKDMKK